MRVMVAGSWLDPKQQSLLIYFNDLGSLNEGLYFLAMPEI